MNVSGILPWSLLSSLPLMILAPWVILHIGWPIPQVPHWVITFHFLAWNKEAELKPTTFSSLLLFYVFLSFFFSWHPSNIVPLSAACWGYSLIKIIRIIIIYITLFFIILYENLFRPMPEKEKQEEGRKGSRHRGWNTQPHPRQPMHSQGMKSRMENRWK